MRRRLLPSLLYILPPFPSRLNALPLTPPRVRLFPSLATDAAKAGSFVQSTGDAAAGGPSSNTGKSLPTGMKEKLGFRQEEPSNQHLGSERGSMDSVDARQSKSMSDVDPEAVAVIEAEDSPQDRAPSAEEPPNQPWIIKGGGNGGVLTDRELSPPNAEAAFHLRKAGGKGNNDIISTQQDRLPPAQDGGGVAKADLIADVVKGDEGEQKHDRHAEAPVVGSTTAAVTVNAGSRGEGTLLTAVPAGDDLGKGGKRHGSGHHHHRHHTEVIRRLVHEDSCRFSCAVTNQILKRDGLPAPPVDSS